MSEAEPQSASTPKLRWYQFSLRTLLLLFVVLGSSLAVFGVGGIVVFILVLLLATDRRQPVSPVQLFRLLVALLCLWCLGGLFMPGVERHFSDASRDALCRNNLKQIALALLNYEKAEGCFPPAYTLDNSGRSMHSWRALTLPYSDMDDLYKKYTFSESWNGPSNKNISNTIAALYLCPSDRKSSGPRWTETNYLAVVGPNAAWAGDKPRKLAELGNRASHTIMVVEATDSGVQWAEPRDFSLDAMGIIGAEPRAVALSSNHRPPEGFFYTYGHASGVNVAMADGSVHFLRTDNLSRNELRKILEIGGCTDEVMQSQGSSYSARHSNWPNIAALAVWLLSVGTLLTCAVRSRKPQAVPPTSPTR